MIVARLTCRRGGIEQFAAFVQSLTDPASAAVDRARKHFVARTLAVASAGYEGDRFWAVLPTEGTSRCSTRFPEAGTGR